MRTTTTIRFGMSSLILAELRGWSRMAVGVFLLGLALTTATVTAQVISEQAGAFELDRTVLEDGSESFGVLIRSDDGLYVYGHLRRPSGAGPFPGVIFVHGGLGASVKGTRNLVLRSTPAHALIEKGYVVLSTDYRSGEWRNEYRDVIAAYEYFKGLPFVRADSIAMMGGSRGAKLTLDVVTRVPLQAAVTCAGPYDLGKYYEHCSTSEFHRRLLQDDRGNALKTCMAEMVEQFGGTPDEVPDAFLAHSGMSRIPLVRAPVLVVHGERDTMVPPFFGLELASALREQGKVVEEHFGARGSHSYYWGFPVIRGTAPDWFKKENEAFVEHLLDFLDKHVKRTGAPY